MSDANLTPDPGGPSQPSQGTMTRKEELECEKLKAEADKIRAEAEHIRKQDNPDDPFWRDWARNMPLLERVSDARTGMLKAAMLMNGGGGVAILTFMGHLATSKEPQVEASALLASVVSFGVGVFLTTLASVPVYCHLQALAAASDKKQTPAGGTPAGADQPADAQHFWLKKPPQFWTRWMFGLWGCACIAFCFGGCSGARVFAERKGDTNNLPPVSISAPTNR